MPRLYGLAQNVSTLKYCPTLEIVFVYFRKDFENFILECKTNRTKVIFWGEKLKMKSRQVISCHPRIQREANVHRMLIKSKSNGKD